MQRLKILILIKPFWKLYAKHRVKYDTIQAIEEFADVHYWYEDGDISEILNQLSFTPDFIYHYDIAWKYAFAPRITGLDKINLPKGCFVIDLHYNPSERAKENYHEQTRLDYIQNNKIDLVFATYKHTFLKQYPQLADKHRWLPWAINPNIFKDWNKSKKIKFLLMGLVHVEHSPPKGNPLKGAYSFREAVLQRMAGTPGFIYHPHPGHLVSPNESALVDVKYGKELNRSTIFFTCGSTQGVPVAKYFEAPACLTLLLAEVNPDLYDLGFREGVNFVACTKEDFYEKAMYYDNNKAEREWIAANGHTLIHNQHTNRVRAKQFIEYVEECIRSRN